MTVKSNEEGNIVYVNFYLFSRDTSHQIVVNVYTCDAFNIFKWEL